MLNFRTQYKKDIKYYVYPGNNAQLIKKFISMIPNSEQILQQQKVLKQANFIWKLNNFYLRVNYYQQEIRILQERSKNQKIFVNHFQSNRLITTKTGLIRSLKQYYKKNQNAILSVKLNKQDYNVWNTTPVSFILTAGIQDKEHYIFTRRYIDRKNFFKQYLPVKHCQKNMWIIKPAGANQGRGIQIFKNLKQFNQIFHDKNINSLWLVQKYIQKPLLIDGRKFDIRQWVLVTPNNDVLFFKKCYMRTSGNKYNINSSNIGVHLTNNSLQKQLQTYNLYQQGNTIDFDRLPQYLLQIQKYKNLEINLMKDIVIDSILSAKQYWNCKKITEFQLFGYDFIIDQDLRTWLIQINNNPYLGVANKFSQQILNQMMEHLVKIIIIPQKYNMEQSPFQIIYCQGNSTLSKQPINKRSSFNDKYYPFNQLCPINQDIKENNNLKIQQQKKTIVNNLKIKITSNNSKIKSKKQENKEPVIRNRDQNNSVKIIKIREEKPKYQQPLYGQIRKLLIIAVDHSEFFKPLNRIFSYLDNWQVLSIKQTNQIYNILEMMFGSRFSSIFLQQKYISNIGKIIVSQNYPQKLQQVIIKGLTTLSRISVLRKKFIPQLMNNIVFLINNLYEKDQFLKHIQKFLWNFVQLFQKRFYIPGQSNQNEKNKMQFLNKGYMADYLILEKKLKINKFKKISFELFEFEKIAENMKTQLQKQKITEQIYNQIDLKLEQLKNEYQTMISMNREKAQKIQQMEEQEKLKQEQIIIKKKEMVAQYIKKKKLKEKKQYKNHQSLKHKQFKLLQQEKKRQISQLNQISKVENQKIKPYKKQEINDLKLKNLQQIRKLKQQTFKNTQNKQIEINKFLKNSTTQKINDKSKNYESHNKKLKRHLKISIEKYVNDIGMIENGVFKFISKSPYLEQIK